MRLQYKGDSGVCVCELISYLAIIIVGPEECRPYSCFSPPSPRPSSPPPAIKPIINKTSLFPRFQHSTQHFIHRRKEESIGVHPKTTNTTTKTNTQTNTKTKAKFRKYKTCAIFLKSRGFKDIKYDILSSVHLSFVGQLSSTQ